MLLKNYAGELGPISKVGAPGLRRAFVYFLGKIGILHELIWLSIDSFKKKGLGDSV